MQLLKKNERAIYIAKCIGASDAGENGLYTGDISPVYSEPIKIMANVSPATGFVSAQPFGLAEEYDAVIHLNASLYINADTVFWLDSEPPEPHDHVVSRVSRNLNSLAVSVKKVKTRA